MAQTRADGDCPHLSVARGSRDGLGYRSTGEGWPGSLAGTLAGDIAPVRLREVVWPGEVSGERKRTSCDSTRVSMQP